MSIRTSVGSWKFRVLHGLLLALGWLLMAGSWVLVLTSPNALLGTTTLLIVIGVSLVLFPLVTLHWVLHNRRIFLRKGPRLTSANPPLQYNQDWTGREVHGDFPALRQEPVVEVRVDGHRKLFEAAASTPRTQPPSVEGGGHVAVA